MSAANKPVTWAAAAILAAVATWGFGVGVATGMYISRIMALEARMGVSK